MEEGVDWKRVAGSGRRGVIVYSDAGAAKLMGVFSAAAPISAEGYEAALECFADGEKGFAVVKCCRNPRFVECCRFTFGLGPPVRSVDVSGWEGESVRVRVKDNRNFIPGMVLKATPGEYIDVWDLKGRCPRYRGRW